MRKLVSIVLTAACVTFFNFKGIAQEVDINKGIELQNQALEAYEAKQYDQAIQYGNEAYKIAAEAGEEGADVKANMEKLIPQAYLGKANNLVIEKQYENAIAAFNEAKTVADKYNAESVKENIAEAFPKVYMAMGKDSYDANDFDAAVTSLTKAVELDPNNSQVYLMLGAAYMKKGDMDGAEQSFAKCAETATTAGNEAVAKNANTQLSNVYLMKASAASKAKKWSDMLTFADKSLAANESLNGYKLKAGAAAQLKRWDAVIEAYDKVVSMGKESDKPTAYYNIAVAYQEKNNTTKACEFYKKLTNDKTYKAHAEQAITALKCK